MALTKSGRNLRWYFQGSAVGMGRMTMLKPDLSQGLDAVKEVGNPDIIEYVLKVPETSINFGFNVINKKQLALAMGQSVGIAGVGEVPFIPENFDVVERRIKPGTEGTLSEVYDGYSIYQYVQVEKQSWDQEVDKLVSGSVSGKCRRPRDFEGINGIQFDKFNGTGAQTTFPLTQKSIANADGTLTIRVESPIGTELKYGVDFTVASTSSSTAITFTNAPASTTAAALAIYAW